MQQLAEANPLALFQLIYGAGLSSTNTEHCYSPGCIGYDNDDD